MTTCQTCGKTHPWPDGTTPRHPFNDGSLAGSAVLTGHEPQTPPVHPFDPVLRQALIDKGVLTPADLRNAEEKVNAVTGRFNDGTETQVGKR